MKYTRLGGTNLEVSEFCLGTMMFGGKTSPEESIGIMRRAVEAGVNFFDTADVYNKGRSEEIVGEALQGMRERVVLATKVGGRMGHGPTDQGISRYHIIGGVEASLRRLHTDRLDILYIHWPYERMNLEEMLRAIEDLVKQGKILYGAASNFPAWLLSHCLGIGAMRGYTPLVVGQYPYSLIERGIEVEVLPLAAALKVGIVTYRPLCAGTLTGKYLGGTPEGSRGAKGDQQSAWSERYAEAVGKLASFAQARGYTAADAAINWVRSHQAVTAPIIGISRLEQLEANLRAFEWEMTAEEREEVTGFFPTAVWEEAWGGFPAWRRSYEIMG